MRSRIDDGILQREGYGFCPIVLKVKRKFLGTGKIKQFDVTAAIVRHRDKRIDRVFDIDESGADSTRRMNYLAVHQHSRRIAQDSLQILGASKFLDSIQRGVIFHRLHDKRRGAGHVRRRH